MKNSNLIASSLLTFALAQGAFAQEDTSVVYVATNGVDSPSCGASASPCRTITQGIANSQPGGAVAVRPGVYGDANGNGQLSGPEEEPNPGPEAAMITIQNAVRLFSTEGAATTIIDGGSAVANVVAIFASDVTFGGVDRGFTIARANNDGLVAIGSNIAVVGNTVRNNAGRGLVLFSTGVIRAVGNSSTHNQNQGFVANAGAPEGYVILRDNVATANGSDGFQLSGTNSAHRLVLNAASDNSGSGVLVTPGPSRLYGNRLSGNSSVGIALSNAAFDPNAAGPTIVRNMIVGNRAGGIGVFTFGAAPPAARIRENNIYGSPASPEHGIGCGVLNNAGVQTDARNNYWGAPTGPGPKPADGVCGGLVTTTPFSTRPFEIPTEIPTTEIPTN
jgi:hypothetical protein